MYVLNKVTKTRPVKLDIGRRSYYFAAIDETEATNIKLGNNYKTATKKLKEYRSKHIGEIVNMEWK